MSCHSGIVIFITLLGVVRLRGDGVWKADPG